MSTSSLAMNGQAGEPLLGPADDPPRTAYRAEGSASVLLVCDHASNAVPAALDSLGLTPAALTRHIAWDIGAAPLTRALADRLDAPAVLCGYSRLVVDCNRHPSDPTAFLEVSDGEVVPGNRDLGDPDRERRLDGIFRPYHQEIEARLARIRSRAIVPALIAVHSFTPRMLGIDRPWHVGILWDTDPRIPVPLLDRLSSLTDVMVGNNEPYSGRHPSDYTVDRHAERTGLPHVCLEIRQDLLADTQAIERWADLLTDALAPILADPALYRLHEPLDHAAT
jgi:predicted N-formylglutamate amidohydrolase